MASAHPAGEPSELLARHGLRATRQRVSVLGLLLAQRGHPTAVELHERLRRAHPNLSQKTVYEILDALVAVGLVSRVAHAGGATRFEALRERHDHAHCRGCGLLYDVPAGPEAAIRRRARLPRGFRIEQIHVTIEGLCPGCARESA